MNHVFAETCMSVAMPYEVRLREEEAVLPARNKLTPVFEVIVTFALELVLDTNIIVEPFAKATFDVVGINRVTFDDCS